jgi:hypothetical protein
MPLEKTTFTREWQAPYNCNVWWKDDGQPLAKGGRAIQKTSFTEIKKGEILKATANSTIEFEKIQS